MLLPPFDESPLQFYESLYSVRNNDRTRYFFNSLLLAGDLISSTHSHQIALVSLLSEHASLYVLGLTRRCSENPETKLTHCYQCRSTGTTWRSRSWRGIQKSSPEASAITSGIPSWRTYSMARRIHTFSIWVGQKTRIISNISSNKWATVSLIDAKSWLYDGVLHSLRCNTWYRVFGR